MQNMEALSLTVHKLYIANAIVEDYFKHKGQSQGHQVTDLSVN